MKGLKIAHVLPNKPEMHLGEVVNPKPPKDDKKPPPQKAASRRTRRNGRM